jgi:hypothetical protein
MRILAGLAIVTAFGASIAATGASAQPGHLSDVAFLQAARCAGLASSSKLGSGDAASLKSLLKSQSDGRPPFILDRADEAQAGAKREADRADDYIRGKLQGELAGACAALRN